MPIQVLFMNNNNYPFGESEENQQSNKTIVKQAIALGSHQHIEALRLAKVSKKLSQNKILVKLETVLEQQSSINLIYQYVPIGLEAWIQTMDKQFLKMYRDQLFQLAEHLAFNGIITNIQLKNLGLNEQYEAKYFLGLNFLHKKQFNKYELKSNYIEEIKILFSPFLVNSNKLIEVQNTNCVQKIDNRLSDVQEIQKVASYIDKKTNNKVKTRKHQSIYYQKSKDKEIKQRKQSYMSSVSNVRLNNLYKRINQVELQVSNTRSPQQNHFKICFQNRQTTSKSSYDNKLRLQKSPDSLRQVANIPSKNSIFQNVRGIKKNNQLQNTLVSLVNNLRASGNKKMTVQKQVKNKKIELYKEKQYLQMANAQDPFFEEFKSVLEDNISPSQVNLKTSAKNCSIRSFQNKSALYSSNNQQKNIQSRVQDVIMNSKKLISKFKEKSKKHLSTQN